MYFNFGPKMNFFYASEIGGIGICIPIPFLKKIRKHKFLSP